MFLLSPSAHRVEHGVHCDDDLWSDLVQTRSDFGLHRYLLVLSVEALPICLEVLHWDLHSLRSVPTSEWILGIRSLFLTILLHHLRMGRRVRHLSGWLILPLLWFFESKYLMHPSFPNLPSQLSEYLISKFPHRNQLTSEKDSRWYLLAKLMNSHLIFRWRQMILNHCSKRYCWPFEWFTKSSFTRCFPVCQEDLDSSQMATACHRIWPPLFIQSWL